MSEGTVGAIAALPMMAVIGMIGVPQALRRAKSAKTDGLRKTMLAPTEPTEREKRLMPIAFVLVGIWVVAWLVYAVVR
ncbi:hypothetical protein [Aeromicrobium sp. Root472D3]|uniref:hypothetical protein n=1 Tax=Aeromicrobium sp. Root472D3 TaxID=1736540 RepID=UPI0012F858E3|nr:hypothetical protein [Aeromicrobium sp. Root472D3]